MKKYFLTIALFISSCFAIAQNSNSNSILVQHDTTLLKAEESEWIIKSLVKNEPALTSEIGKPLSLILLQAIEKGKIKAIDPQTNKTIPAKEIFTWKMPEDTVPLYDNEGNILRYQVIKRLHSERDLTQVRIFQDWYFDISSGKFHSVIKWIELMENITTSQGVFIGMTPLCRIYY